MKTFNKISLLLCLGLFACNMLNSCKKIDSKNEVLKTDLAKQKIIDRIEATYGKVTTPSIYKVGKEASGFYINDQGLEIPIIKKKQQAGSENLCGLDCNTASDPGDLEFSYVLDYVQRFFYCGNTTGSEIISTWYVSVPYSLLDASPLNPSVLSKGRMRFKSSSGAILITNTNLTPVTITLVGGDPNCSQNLLYTVTYKWEGLDDSYFSSGNTLECAVDIYNDCDLVNNRHITGYLQAIVFNGFGSYAQPCSRIDKVWINSSTGSNSGQCATAAGAYLTCPSYPFGFTPTTSQQVEYRERDNPASLEWDEQNSIVLIGEKVEPGYPLSSTVSACCGVLFLREMYQGVSSTGWLVRYRNVYTGCAVISPINSTWVTGTYITEYWLY